jgi:hypothetical protein
MERPNTDRRVFGPAGAAIRLGIPRSTLESKIRALGIDKAAFGIFHAKVSWPFVVQKLAIGEKSPTNNVAKRSKFNSFPLAQKLRRSSRASC